MKKSLITEFGQADLNQFLQDLSYEDYYYASLFPVMFTPSLTWKTISSDMGLNVAADVVSYNSASGVKQRKAVSELSGSIPKIEVTRVKEESDLNEYQHLRYYYSSEEGEKALIDWVYNDTEFCFRAINSRLEWLALKALSTGGFTLNSTNNVGVTTETTVSFNLPAKNKIKVENSWTNTITATPITDIRNIVETAMGKGIRIKYMFMDIKTFYEMVACEQVVEFCSSWVKNEGQLRIPTVDDINSAFDAHRLPTIEIIDTYVTIETSDGKRKTENPWEKGFVTFVPELKCGFTFHAPMADEMVKDSVATKAKKDHVLVKKYSTENPVTEVTKGIANAIPVWNNADSCYILNTNE